MNGVVRGNLEAIDQLIEFISNLDGQDYQAVYKPAFSGSIGQHLRHINDLYYALIKYQASADNQPKELIDYDVRRRGARVESDRATGLLELQEIRQWLTQLNNKQLQAQCQVKIEVMLSESLSAEAASTFARELCFVSSHLTHHVAIMAALSRLLGNNVEENIGLAPTTASFVRGQQPAEAVVN